MVRHLLSLSYTFVMEKEQALRKSETDSSETYPRSVFSVVGKSRVMPYRSDWSAKPSMHMCSPQSSMRPTSTMKKQKRRLHLERLQSVLFDETKNEAKESKNG